MKYEIKPVSENEYPECADVIRQSFATVARDFNLTRENAPTNPAFIELRHIQKMKEKGISMFGLYEEGMLCGFAALERLNGDDFCLERLSVIPGKRHNGYGTRLLDYVACSAKNEGGKRIKIGIINENAVLKDWYLNYGFTEVETKIFEHLPFTVCYLQYGL